MGVISVRIPDDLHRELLAADVKLTDVVKADLELLARKLLIQRKLRLLAKHQVKAKRPVAEIIRETRDEG